MEDRFVVNDDIDRTGVSLFAIFDGHGGQVSPSVSRFDKNEFFNRTNLMRLSKFQISIRKPEANSLVARL